MIDLHQAGTRQGPGGAEQIRLALTLSQLDKQAPLQIAGCGTGAATLLQTRFAAFLDRHGHSEDSRAVVAAEEHEISLYQRYAAYITAMAFIWPVKPPEAHSARCA